MNSEQQEASQFDRGSRAYEHGNAIETNKFQNLEKRSLAHYEHEQGIHTKTMMAVRTL